MKEQEFPKSLLQATRYFADPDVCVQFVASLRWIEGAQCPYCNGKAVSYLKSRRIFKCMAKECHKQFSVKTGTIFEDSAIPLDKWLTAIWLIVNCKNGISSYKIARDLKLTQKSAWFVLHRIRLALANSSWFKLGGEEGGPVEVDVTFMGARDKNKHVSHRKWIPDGKGGFKQNPDYKPHGGYQEKAPVVGMLDRELRKVRAHVIPYVKREALMDAILNNVGKNSTIYTDGHTGYNSLDSMEDFVHESVNHMNEYVRGEVHTTGLRTFGRS